MKSKNPEKWGTDKFFFKQSAKGATSEYQKKGAFHVDNLEADKVNALSKNKWFAIAGHKP